MNPRKTDAFYGCSFSHSFAAITDLREMYASVVNGLKYAVVDVGAPAITGNLWQISLKLHHLIFSESPPAIPSVSPPPLGTHSCNFSGCTASTTKRCSACKEIWYCSQEHQSADWGRHQRLCRKKVPANAAAAAAIDETPPKTVAFEEVPTSVAAESVSAKKNSTEYSELLKSNLNFLVRAFDGKQPSKTLLVDRVIHEFRNATTTFISQLTPFLREKYRQAIQSIFRESTKHLNLEECDILEIGSGDIFKIESDGRISSYLSNLLPHRSWIFSDYPARAAKYNLINTSSKYIGIDLTSPIPNLKMNCIVGCNVLDTVPYHQLKQVFSNIAKVLKPNEVCIHFADLNLLTTTFFDAIAHKYPESIAFPAPMRQRCCIQISKIEFNRILAEKKDQLSAQEIDFLTQWGLQDIRLQLTSMVVVDGAQQAERDSFVDRIQTIFSPHITIIDSLDLFEQYLKHAAAQTGFIVEKCGFEKAFVSCRQLIPGTENHHIFSRGIEKSFNNPTLKIDEELIESDAHVFIMRKL